MRFLVLIHEDADAPDAGPPPESLIEAIGTFRDDTTLGRLLDDGGLMPPADALRLRTSNGRSSVLDEPCAEAKEVIGGFFIVESSSPDDVSRWAHEFVDLHSTHWPQASFAAEVRQIADPPVA
ncbi:YciI family protein [Aeromicrobium fastidiosum]|uniref:Transcriptional regulator n=1 Tax=Aeromicrobium fastidiosum TaxID=52699 RepID=A0A641APX7_9ACTN|nr:YciI family protein [Aeromicrobium fastidiosum]KAA1380156.1 transcriptional regulator [Aeromicrobium fastidiosum]MBP2389691.1 hypothetical protein [Aeromicrobium fastidiosum]